MKQSLRRVLLPTWGQAWGSLGISLAIIGLLYRDQIWQRIRSGSVNTVLGQLGYNNQISGITNSPVVHTLVIVAFWSAIGLVAYTVVWSLINVMIEAKNEVVLETAYTNKSAFVQRARTPLLQLGLAAVLFIGLLVCAHTAFPYWLRLAYAAINATSVVTMAGYAVLAVGGLTINIYALLLLGQLIFWLG